MSQKWLYIKIHALLIHFNHASNGYKMNVFLTIEQMTQFDQWLKNVQFT